MEPHATIACWEGDHVVLHESSQGVAGVRATVAGLFGLEEDDVEVASPHVGGGFGTKGALHAGTVLTVLAARTVPGRAVKRALSRREMFETVGHRPATVQHLALGATADGRLEALVHDVVESTARVREFGEPTATGTRGMYAAPHRRTSHQLVPLDVDVPTYMRAPGEAPGSFGLECAVDELAVALGMDPIELRVRNEPEVHPESGLPFSSRNLVACLRRGAERFGWASRPTEPRASLVDGWWHGTGVAAAMFPTIRFPGSTAVIRFAHGRYEVRDRGHGHRAGRPDGAHADRGGRARGAGGPDRGRDRRHRPARRGPWPAGRRARRRGARRSPRPPTGSATSGATTRRTARRPTPRPRTTPGPASSPWPPTARSSPRSRCTPTPGRSGCRGCSGCTPRAASSTRTLARSQFLGGMVWGLSMALHEQSVVDPRFGHVINHDLADYHIAAHADVREMDAEWVDEDDPYVNPMGSKGIGEIGIVGTAAAIANAVHHATGVRVRSLPMDFVPVDEFGR